MSWNGSTARLGNFCRYSLAALLLSAAFAGFGQTVNSDPNSANTSTNLEKDNVTAALPTAQTTNAPIADTHSDSLAPTTNSIEQVRSQLDTTANTNGYIPPSAATNDNAAAEARLIQTYRDRMAGARELVLTRQFNIAETALIALLPEKVPDDIRKEALFQLSAAVAGEGDLSRAQTILAQYLERWPGDVRTPEVLLRQGEIFRRMGLNNLALGKFYGVMTTALSLKGDQMDFYQSLVLQAQIEIAETHFLIGQYDESAEFYSRLLKRSDTGLNRALAQFRLVRSLAGTTNKTECVAQAQDFISRYPQDPEAPEVRYYLSQSLKSMGQNSEALRQVLLFLQEEKSVTQQHPEVWGYWQQRVGNEIANELYKEGDYVKALEVYNSLVKLNDSPAWQIPVDYQIGITYERLMQPERASAAYNQILNLEPVVGTNTTPSLQTVFDMSRWRTNFLAWQTRVDAVNHSMIVPAVTNLPPLQAANK